MITYDTKILVVKDKTRDVQREKLLEVENGKVKEHTLFRPSWQNLITKRLKIQRTS